MSATFSFAFTHQLIEQYKSLNQCWKEYFKKEDISSIFIIHVNSEFLKTHEELIIRLQIEEKEASKNAEVLVKYQFLLQKLAGEINENLCLYDDNELQIQLLNLKRTSSAVEISFIESMWGAFGLIHKNSLRILSILKPYFEVPGYKILLEKYPELDKLFIPPMLNRPDLIKECYDLLLREEIIDSDYKFIKRPKGSICIWFTALLHAGLVNRLEKYHDDVVTELLNRKFKGLDIKPQTLREKHKISKSNYSDSFKNEFKKIYKIATDPTIAPQKGQ